MESLNSLKDLTQFNSFLNELKPEIGRNGGRYFKQTDGTKLRMNDIVRTFDKIVCEQVHQAPSGSPKEMSQEDRQTIIKDTIKKMKDLGQEGKDLLGRSSVFKRVMTSIRQALGNLFFDRNHLLKQTEFGKRDLASSVDNHSYLPLKGQKGTLYARVSGKGANTLPSRSDHGTWEYMARTEARVVNLVAFRGELVGERMIGPCDVPGRLHNPYEHEYTIDIHKGKFAIEKHKIDPQKVDAAKVQNALLETAPSTTLSAEWIRGGDDKIKMITPPDQEQQQVGESLFESKGVLQIAGGDSFKLKKFDARTVDLAPYKARLVKNDQPFHITKEKLSSKDDLQIATYHYEPKYAEAVVKKGGGLFLETHSFSQTMTPLGKDCVGFVTLAKWKDASVAKQMKNTTPNTEIKGELEVIGVEIPFGYTLVVEGDCIHGDTNLNGMFLMCMTSSHHTMATADTVFLKTAESNQNVALSIEGAKQQPAENADIGIPPVLSDPLA
jgi:hypothetical protein